MGVSFGLPRGNFSGASRFGLGGVFVGSVVSTVFGVDRFLICSMISGLVGAKFGFVGGLPFR